MALALRRLPSREALVLQRRIGLSSEGELVRTYTLDEIGSLLGVTRERVRQLQTLAIEHLAEMKLAFVDIDALRENITVEKNGNGRAASKGHYEEADDDEDDEDGFTN